jgi:hypothetical protein
VWKCDVLVLQNFISSSLVSQTLFHKIKQMCMGFKVLYGDGFWHAVMAYQKTMHKHHINSVKLVPVAMQS